MAEFWLEVAFPIPLYRTFHYAVDANHSALTPTSWIGHRVLAPFGPKQLVGYVVDVTADKPPFPTKPILKPLDEQRLLTDDLLQLARWLSQRYLCTLGEALACVLPRTLEAPRRARGNDSEKKEVIPSTDRFKLTEQQADAFAVLGPAVTAGAYTAFMLRGVTDSGKTELYLRAIEEAMRLGKQAIFLVPEIALTPPFIERLEHRFGSDRIGLWHSGVSGRDRYETWHRAMSGELSVIVGPRSAIFAPFPRLGVIVVDEEHEPSYKQEERPRYHAREVAMERARQHNAVLILGSATPSIESYWRAQQGEFKLLELTERVANRRMPPVTIVDRRPPSRQPDAAEKKPARRSAYQPVFSETLKIAIEQRLARREQAMLFVNRRGFTPFLRCGLCGWVARCQRCSSTLTLHVSPRSHGFSKTKQGVFPVTGDTQLQCHVCLHTEQAPSSCGACGKPRLRSFGVGTQRVEEELREQFPFVRVSRLDRDAASSRQVFEKIYQDFSTKKTDILVGTQMIAKGFDFPGVTLVGIVDADVSLHLPDFRSSERTFQLIAQVAGRTGRSAAGGVVVIQTQAPDHYAVSAACQHDYLGFYAKELRFREALRYPPFTRLISCIVRSPKDEKAREAAETVADALIALQSGAEVLGPAPAPYARIRGQFRYHILIKGNDLQLKPIAEDLRHRKLRQAFLSVDIDPIDLL